MDGHGRIEEDGCSRGRAEDGEAHMKRQKVVKYVDWEYQKNSGGHQQGNAVSPSQ